MFCQIGHRGRAELYVCGVCGCVDSTVREPFQTLAAMTAGLSHRGRHEMRVHVDT